MRVEVAGLSRNRAISLSWYLPCVIYPSGNSATRVARLANIPHESWMQDWPVEVSDPERLDDFTRLLLAHKSDWELSYWLLDLVLDSAESHLATTAAPERTEQLIDTLLRCTRLRKHQQSPKGSSTGRPWRPLIPVRCSA